MDYYQKYLKYKAKYLDLKNIIYGSANKTKCTNDNGCEPTQYCSTAFGTYHTCVNKKRTGASCNRDTQCLKKCGNNKNIFGNSKCI